MVLPVPIEDGYDELLQIVEQAWHRDWELKKTNLYVHPSPLRVFLYGSFGTPKLLGLYPNHGAILTWALKILRKVGLSVRLIPRRLKRRPGLLEAEFVHC